MLAKKSPKILFKHPFLPLLGRGQAIQLFLIHFLEQLALSILVAVGNHDFC